MNMRLTVEMIKATNTLSFIVNAVILGSEPRSGAFVEAILRVGLGGLQNDLRTAMFNTISERHTCICNILD